MDSSSESDYDVDEFVRPDKVRKSVNDDSADLLGNFDDAKRKEIMDGTYEDKENSEEESDDEEESEEEESSDEEENDQEMPNEVKDQENEKETDVPIQNSNKNGVLSKDQIAQLRKGAAKTNRFVLYVTNLNFETGKSDLEDHFGAVGSVRSVRIPKNRRGGSFAFVEMNDLESYQEGFQLHDTELQGRRIKVQISEAGKKKSANKKNIMKQKNRKLAEMRNETKRFTKSGKFFDKTIKKEIASQLPMRQRWRKNPTAGGGVPRQK